MEDGKSSRRAGWRGRLTEAQEDTVTLFHLFITVVYIAFYPLLIVCRRKRGVKRRENLFRPLFEAPPHLAPLCSHLSLRRSLFLCNRSSSAHFKPKHVCLAPKQTRPPLSPLLILLPLPQQTPFPIQRDDVMPMLRKTRGLWSWCLCVRVCVCAGGWRAAMG